MLPSRMSQQSVGLSGTILALKLIHQLLLPEEWWQLWLLYTLGHPAATGSGVLDRFVTGISMVPGFPRELPVGGGFQT